MATEKLYTAPILNLGSKWNETLAINNRLYRFHFNWNVNGADWELNISDDSDNLLVGGIRVVTIINLVDEYKEKVDFNLYVVPITDKKEITLDNFSTDFELVVQFYED